MTPEAARVLLCNQAFYAAFARRDPEAMDRIWATEHAVTCVHPGWALLEGRDAVMESWQAILGGDGLPIEATDERAFVEGDAAYVICLEGMQGGDAILIATNVFAREAGEWRMVHHHAGQLARPITRAPATDSN